MFNTIDSANIYLSENFIQSNLNGSIEISINELYALMLSSSILSIAFRRSSVLFFVNDGFNLILRLLIFFRA